MPLLVPPSSSVPHDQLTYIHAWNSIVRRARMKQNGSAGVMILAGIDLDAILATQILKTLLKQEDVQYSIVPITGYLELQAQRDRLFGPLDGDGAGDGDAMRDGGNQSDVHDLILLSLGALYPLSEEFPLHRASNPTNLNSDNNSDTDTDNLGINIHLIDARRPYNLGNLFGVAVEDGLGAGWELSGGGRNGGYHGDGYGNGGEPSGSKRGGGGRIWVWGDGEEGKLRNLKKSYQALEMDPGSDSDSDFDSDSNSEADSGSEGGSSGSGSGSDTEGDDDDDDHDGHEDAGHNGNGNGEEEQDDSDPGSKRRRLNGDEGREGEGEGGRGRKRRKKRGREKKERNGGAGADGEGEDGEKPRRLTRLARQAHWQRMQRYYQSGTSYGISVAECVYMLATEMQRGENDLLWYAILGLTHQYISSRIDRETYDLRYSGFCDEVALLNPRTSPPHNQPHRSNSSSSLGGSSNNGAADDKSISRTDELRFVLFRHWDLYDAMLHSGYVAGRMGIWKDRGRKKLQGLLAKMGFSMQQSKQAYSHMDMDLKSTLREKLGQIAPEYGLVELEYPSFLRAFGYRCTALSAADGVEGLNALLEAATGIRVEVETDLGKGGGEWFGSTKIWNVSDVGVGLVDEVMRNGSGGDGKVARVRQVVGETQGDFDEELDRHAKQDQKRGETNYFITERALTDVKLLSQSLGLAKGLHSAIIRQGCSILDKNSMKTLKAFRFVTIREGPDLRLFCHASTLSRLALWLLDATRDKVARVAESKRKEPAHPIVLACLNEERGTYLVVGLSGSPEFGDVKKNHFGLAFVAAAEESGTQSRHDMFDSSIVEVRKDDLTGFIESLHLQTA